jgi:hypothetical protein
MTNRRQHANVCAYCAVWTLDAKSQPYCPVIRRRPDPDGWCEQWTEPPVRSVEWFEWRRASGKQGPEG